MSVPSLFFFFFFNDTATTEIYTLSLHDALPISGHGHQGQRHRQREGRGGGETPREPRIARARAARLHPFGGERSEEHTSELQSRLHLVCRLLLEKKKKNIHRNATRICIQNTASR